MPVDPLEAFGLFYKDNSGPVFRALLAGTLNRAAAEDATAEAFARALAHWDTVASHPNPKAWVLRVAWNHHRSDSIGNPARDDCTRTDPARRGRATAQTSVAPSTDWRMRSEERRVGKECRSRWSAPRVRRPAGGVG